MTTGRSGDDGGVAMILRAFVTKIKTQNHAKFLNVKNSVTPKLRVKKQRHPPIQTFPPYTSGEGLRIHL